ncbi:MAG: hypothetical protein M3Q27_04515 [Actinomycetota bacterium]|nr:hypothetical protein [Actinomycetota bacterium]
MADTVVAASADERRTFADVLSHAESGPVPGRGRLFQFRVYAISRPRRRT